MEYVILNNGIKMPLLGFGTYQINANIAEKCVLDAINIGYRLIDTAQYYQNEKEIGKACRKSKIPRSEFFITTKLWGCVGYQDTLKSIKQSLDKLDLDYIDLLLIHEPSGKINEIYSAMEKIYETKKIKAIGISNFLEYEYLNLIKHCKIIPAINQVETHIFRQQKKLQNLEKQYGTIHQSWSPLAYGLNNIFKNSVLNEIGKVHNKTAAQIALRFLTQQKIIAIPKSSHIERMKENFESLNFILSDEEIKKIELLETGKSLFNWW